MRISLFLLAFTVALPAEAQQRAVKFVTGDGCGIEAFYAAPSSGNYIFINAHGLGSGKEEWGPFQDALAERGYGWLSLDLRGHGGSLDCGGKKADYRKFSKAEWGSASRDIEAAALWLKKKGYKKIIFCGASIGANLSLKAAAEGAVKPAGVILLSPGLDYAGVKPELYLAKAPKRLLFAAAEDDRYAWRSALTLHGQAGKKGLRPSSLDGGSGHGVTMFKTPATINEILGWTGR
jgi:alpha-beta hydrolase superfamily lysophospholipase